MRKGFFRPTLFHSDVTTVERNIIHDCHLKYSSPHAPSRGWPDAGRAWSAKTLWLVRWSWSHPVETGIRETGLQTGMAVAQLCHPGRGGWWPLRRAWVLDAPGCRRNIRCHVYGYL